MNRRDVLKGTAALAVVAAVGLSQEYPTTVEVHRKTLDGWHHYAVSRYRGVTKYFIDGKQVGEVGPAVASFSGSSAQWEQHWGILDDMAASMPDGDWCVAANGCGEWLDGVSLTPMA